MNRYAHRVFVTCSNGVLVVVDPEQSKVVARVSVGRSAGDVVFDDDLHLVFTSSHEGNIAIVQQDFPDKYWLTRSIATGLAPATITIALDAVTHRVFVAPVESAQAAKTSRDAAIKVVVLGYSSNIASPQ